MPLFVSSFVRTATFPLQTLVKTGLSNSTEEGVDGGNATGEFILVQTLYFDKLGLDRQLIMNSKMCSLRRSIVMPRTI